MLQLTQSVFTLDELCEAAIECEPRHYVALAAMLIESRKAQHAFTADEASALLDDCKAVMASLERFEAEGIPDACTDGAEPEEHNACVEQLGACPYCGSKGKVMM
jgi:hypothetical protein